MPDHVPLDEQLALRLAKREVLGRLRRLSLGLGKVDFSSNSYLSLSSQPDLLKIYLSRLSSAGTGFALGSGGSRLLDGNSAFAEDLEKRIAAFHRAPTGLLFNSGFEANTGLLSCVPQFEDVVVYDELVHASIHDGLRLSRARRKIPFAHNTVSQPTVDASAIELDSTSRPTTTITPQGLEQVLQHLVNGPDGPSIQGGLVNVFIAVEGLYSMDGDVAPLKDIVLCTQKYLPKGNGYLIVDEAHSTGLFDREGQGLVCELGLEKHVWARVHTFGKAVDCSGAAVLGSELMRQYLINYARSFIFTTAMGFPQLASIRTSYDFLADGRARALISRLNTLSRHCRDLLSALCARLRPALEILQLQDGTERSPIVGLLTNQPHSLAQYCQRDGFMVRAIMSPTVPKGKERIRICLHAKNTFDEVAGLCWAVERWLRTQLREEVPVDCKLPEEPELYASVEPENVLLLRRAKL